MMQRGSGSGSANGKVHRIADSGVTTEKQAMAAAGCVAGSIFAGVATAAYLAFVMVAGWAVLTFSATLGASGAEWGWGQQFAAGLVTSLALGLAVRRAR